MEKATIKSSLESATLKAKTLSTGGYLIESSQHELQGLDAAADEALHPENKAVEEKEECKSRNQVSSEKKQGTLGSFPYSNTIHSLLLKILPK